MIGKPELRRAMLLSIDSVEIFIKHTLSFRVQVLNVYIGISFRVEVLNVYIGIRAVQNKL